LSSLYIELVHVLLQGYESTLDTRFVAKDEASFRRLSAKFGPEDSVDDAIAMIDVDGPGSPTASRWFWSSNQVYMQLEPAWLSVFSVGILDSPLLYIRARRTPG
jgi:hypothetical protein